MARSKGVVGIAMTGQELIPFRGALQTWHSNAPRQNGFRVVEIPYSGSFRGLLVDDCKWRLESRNTVMTDPFAQALRRYGKTLSHDGRPHRFALLQENKGYTVAEVLRNARIQALARKVLSEVTLTQAVHAALAIPLHVLQRCPFILFPHKEIEIKVGGAFPGVTFKRPEVRQVYFFLQRVGEGRSAFIRAGVLPTAASVCCGGSVYVAFNAPPVLRRII